MKIRNIVLDTKRKNVARIDRNEYFKKYGIYDNEGNYKKLTVGSPVVICIDGLYYDLNKLCTICIKGKDLLEEFIRDCKAPIFDIGITTFIPKFIWG